MVGAPKGFSKFILLLVVVILLSCCSPSSSFAFLPHVSRTDDAVIIDCITNNFPLIIQECWPNLMFFIFLNSVDGVGYAPAYHNKNFYGEIINPEINIPSFNHYAMMGQRLPFYNWQTYSYGHPSLIAPVGVASTRESGEPNNRQLAVKQAIQCGRGPATMPKTRLGITEKITGGTNTKKNIWPYVVSLFLLMTRILHLLLILVK
jgi:hypothetical protein